MKKTENTKNDKYSIQYMKYTSLKIVLGDTKKVNISCPRSRMKRWNGVSRVDKPTQRYIHPVVWAIMMTRAFQVQLNIGSVVCMVQSKHLNTCPRWNAHEYEHLIIDISLKVHLCRQCSSSGSILFVWLSNVSSTVGRSRVRLRPADEDKVSSWSICLETKG